MIMNKEIYEALKRLVFDDYEKWGGNARVMKETDHTASLAFFEMELVCKHLTLIECRLADLASRCHLRRMQ